MLRCDSIQEGTAVHASVKVSTAKKDVQVALTDKGRSKQSEARVTIGVEGEREGQGEVQDDWGEVEAEDESANVEAQVVVEKEGTCRVA